MNYKSNKNAVLLAMTLCKKEFCDGVGTLVVAESKSLTPVLTGNLKKSIVSETMDNNKGVYIGVNESAPYGIMVEKGTSRQKAQPYLEPGAMNTIPKIVKVANQIYKTRMGK